MAALVLSLLLLAMAGHSSGLWCVCKTGLSDTVLQNTLDYACGKGADCNPTHPKAPCFNPDNVRAHCNYAVNSFFQKKGQSPGSCDFSGTATTTNTDPSYSGCTYPNSASGSSGSTSVTPGTTNPKGSSTTTTLPGGNSPYSGNQTNGVFGSNTTGGVNPDYSTDSSAFALKNSNKFFICFIVIVSYGFS